MNITIRQTLLTDNSLVNDLILSDASGESVVLHCWDMTAMSYVLDALRKCTCDVDKVSLGDLMRPEDIEPDPRRYVIG